MGAIDELINASKQRQLPRTSATHQAQQLGIVNVPDRELDRQFADPEYDVGLGAAAFAEDSFLQEQASNIIMENVFEFNRQTGEVGAFRGEEGELDLVRTAAGLTEDDIRTKEGLEQLIRDTREAGGVLPPILEKGATAAANYIRQQRDRYEQEEVGITHDMLAWIAENPEEAAAEVVIGGAASLIPGVGVLGLLARGGTAAAFGRAVGAEALIGGIVPSTAGLARHAEIGGTFNAAGMDYDTRRQYFTELAFASGLSAVIGGTVRGLELKHYGGGRVLSDDDKNIAEALILRKYFGDKADDLNAGKKAEFIKLIQGDAALHGKLIKEIDDYTVTQNDVVGLSAITLHPPKQLGPTRSGSRATI